MSVVDRPIVLALNKSWQPIGTRSVREAIVAMNSCTSKSTDDRAAVGLDIQYGENEDGSYDFENVIAMIPTHWDDWVKLPVLPFHESIKVPESEKIPLGLIRVPTIVIATNYNHMPLKTFRPSKKTIYARDKGLCQYSGKKLSYSEATLDHVLPRSKGGKDTFENMVLCAPDVNFKKGNKSNKEAGLKLSKQPKPLPPTPAIALINEARHRDWKWFLAKNL